MKKKYNFTLMEMMMVIALIALLALLLFPAFDQIKETAISINCFNKMKSLGQLGLQYTSNNDGKLLTGSYVSQKVVPVEEKNGKFTLLEGAEANDADVYLAEVPEELSWLELVCASELPGVALNTGNPGTKNSFFHSLLCDNTLPLWQDAEGINIDSNAITSYNWAIKELAKPYFEPGTSQNLALEEGGPITLAVPLYSGSFGCAEDTLVKRSIPVFHYCDNQNDGAYTGVCGGTNHGNEYVALQADVASPAKRAQFVEKGEDIAADQIIFITAFRLKDYKKGIKGRASTDNSTKFGTYIPGYGAAGVGKESIEKYGYSEYTRTHDIFDDIKRDVEEGRHNGYTNHVFFDGHAERIKAEEVGRNQKNQKGEAHGPYAKIDDPGGDLEED